MHHDQPHIAELSRRSLLKSIGFAPVLLRPANLWGLVLPSATSNTSDDARLPLSYADVRYKPHYPDASPLDSILKLVAPGSDTYQTEKYAFEIGSILTAWSGALKISAQDRPAPLKFLSSSVDAPSLKPIRSSVLRSGYGVDVTQRIFGPSSVRSPQQFAEEIHGWLGPLTNIDTAEFDVFRIDQESSDPLRVRAKIRYDIVAVRTDGRREERVGIWDTAWSHNPDNNWLAHCWHVDQETYTVGQPKAFVDVTGAAFNHVDSYKQQMLRGMDYWRTVMDSACGIDIYGNNGVAVGDYNNDGFDDIYLCQPSGLPNRLYRNQGDGTFEDVTELAGVGVLDNTACALFADFQNRGQQDLLVVCGNGPSLYVNQGDGTFLRKPDAFTFATPPQGSFTHAAVADYDGDGLLDIYFCTYMYYLGLDQYHYPAPYYDARNGPPNCLFRNRGDGTFVETTEAAGLNAENNRYSFAAAWGNTSGGTHPDLCIANDFGVSQLYSNNGDGTFTVASKQSHIEDVGAGMSAAWADFNNDGRQDIYIASMWEAAGQRVSEQPQFHQSTPEEIRKLYQRHAQGNALYRNDGNGEFTNIGDAAGVAMGRWSWSSDFWDFDHDGYTDLYIANGYISAVRDNDLASFFWRQVVGQSPDDNSPSTKYERGWNAINELIRSDNSWNGFERNVMYANNRDGTFSEVSGVVGLDFLDDSRCFALADLDHDGRLEVVLKNRNAPQIRVLHNSMENIGASISFRLRGKTSNRDAIGAAVAVASGSLQQKKYIQAGSGFLSQHSKELFFGLGKPEADVKVHIYWPSGLVQSFDAVPINHRVEIIEGAKTFQATPFTATSESYKRPATPPEVTPLPLDTETWLISPLRAPAFSLPDLNGNMHSLDQHKGNFILLTFWSTTAPLSQKQLRSLNKHRSESGPSKLKIIAVNVDTPAALADAHAFTASAHFDFPVLFASDQVAGIYNIIYRYLFDRRRDLGLPTSFLLDREGMIIKVYQGQVEGSQVLRDIASAPGTSAQRLHRALPFTGILQEPFQRNAFTYGVAMFQRGYLDEAAESFKQVIHDSPKNAEGFYNLGTLYLRSNDLGQARTYLEQTVALRPDYPEAWNNLGMIAAQQGDVQTAIANFRHALDLRPTYEVALLNLGNIFRRQHAFADAQVCLTKALALQPGDPDVNYSLGMLEAQQDHLQTAATFLDKAIAIRPSFTEALNNLGIILVRLHEDDKAEMQFTKCINIDPKNEQAYLNLARLYTMHDDRKRATEVLKQLLSIQPNNPTATSFLQELQ